MFTMLNLLRRSRVMVLAMTLLAPGIAGTAVQWLHSCPTETQSFNNHQDHGSSSSQANHSQGCECIGACNTATVTAPTRAVTVAALVARPERRVVPPSGPSFVPVGTPFDLLPPATAPPLS